MKKLILLGALALGLSASANDNKQLEDRAVNITQRLADMVYDQSYNMSRKDLQDVIHLTREAIQVVRGRSDRRPRLSVYKLQFEDRIFTMEARSLNDLNRVCNQKLANSNLMLVDDIRAKVQGGQSVHFKASGYFNETKNQCNVAVAAAAASAYKAGMQNSTSEYVLYGLVENQGLFATGNSLAELEANCEKSLVHVALMDQIHVAINGSRFVKKSISGYFGNSREACATAISTVF